DGSYVLSNIPARNYSIRVKGAKWLPATRLLDTRSGLVTELNALLLGGDANNDSVADVEDLSLFIQSFDKCQGDNGFVDGADFNCDVCCDVDDPHILIRNFDKTSSDP